MRRRGGAEGMWAVASIFVSIGNISDHTHSAVSDCFIRIFIQLSSRLNMYLNCVAIVPATFSASWKRDMTRTVLHFSGFASTASHSSVELLQVPRLPTCRRTTEVLLSSLTRASMHFATVSSLAKSLPSFEPQCVRVTLRQFAAI